MTPTAHTTPLAHRQVIWVMSVILNKIYPEYGEALNVYSPMQAVGFVFLILGQLVYDGEDLLAY
jgi:hypothetical protein